MWTRFQVIRVKLAAIIYFLFIMLYYYLKIFMNADSSYNSVLLTGETYLFTSTGPSGSYPMAINFAPLERYNIYNLAFGLYTGGTINDSFVSNNGDQNTILRTISNQALLFLDQYPTASLYFEGSSMSRTKLYERKIKRYYFEISKKMHIYGYSGESNTILSFATGGTYNAFLIKRKY